MFIRNEKIDINNPCEICIINPMCKEACDKFANHLKNIIDPNGLYDSDYCIWIASIFKQGALIIYEEDGDPISWRWPLPWQEKFEHNLYQWVKNG